jgi:hypothetical protein
MKLVRGAYMEKETESSRKGISYANLKLKAKQQIHHDAAVVYMLDHLDIMVFVDPQIYTYDLMEMMKVQNLLHQMMARICLIIIWDE